MSNFFARRSSRTKSAIHDRKSKVAARQARQRQLARRKRFTSFEPLEDRRVMAVGDLLQTWGAASETADSAQFGTGIATDGQRTIVGVPHATVGGFSSAGLARVYDNQTGTLLATLPNPSPNTFELHGFSVAIAGPLAVVSTYRDGAIANSAGSVSIYDWATSTLLRTIHQPNAVGNEQFGYAVDLNADNGNWLLVGSRLDNAGTPGGKAFLFDPTTGNLLATMTNPSGMAGDFFGMSVSVDGGISVVGAPTNDTGASNAGAAYAFDSTGSLLATFVNPTPAENDRFGESVDIAGGKIAVGAFGDNTFRGAAYVFGLNGALQHSIINPTPDAFDEFGRSVSISTSNLAVSTNADDTNGIDSGIVHLFDTTTGALTMTIQNPSPNIGDLFGNALSLSATGLAVAAYQDDTAFNNGGAAYLFQVANQQPTASPDTAAANEDATVSTNVIANDIDPDGDLLSLVPGSVGYLYATDNQNIEIPLATASAVAVGPSIVFNPGSDFKFLSAGMSAIVRIPYTVSDVGGQTNSSELTITLTGMNDAPVANSVEATVPRNGSVQFTMTASDPESTPPPGFPPQLLTFTPGMPMNGTLSGFGAERTFTPLTGFVGVESFNYIVSDGLRTATGQITITVTAPPNVPPIDIAPNQFQVDEDNRVIQSLGVLTAIDADANESFSFAIDGGPDAAKFSMGGPANNELIFDGRTLDFETRALYEVLVKVTDSENNFYTEMLQVSVNDVVEPVRILGTSPLLNEGPLSAGGNVIDVAFSEIAQGADEAANYEMRRAGVDGQLDTADDVIEVPTSVYVLGAIATLEFADLLADQYRLTVRDSITSLAGNALDGDDDGQAGGNWSQEFEVAPNDISIGGFLLTNVIFSNGGTQIDGLAELPFFGEVSLAGTFENNSYTLFASPQNVELAGFTFSNLQLTLSDNGLSLDGLASLAFVGDVSFSGSLESEQSFSLIAAPGPLSVLNGLVQFYPMEITLTADGISVEATAEVSGVGQANFSGYIFSDDSYDLSATVNIELAGFELNDVVLALGETVLDVTVTADLPYLGSIDFVGTHGLNEVWALAAELPAVNIAGFDLSDVTIDLSDLALTIDSMANLPLVGNANFAGSITSAGNLEMSATLGAISLLGGLVEFQEPIVTLTLDGVTLETVANIADIGSAEFSGTIFSDGSYLVTASASINLAGFSIDGVEFTLGSEELAVDFELPVPSIGVVGFSGSYDVHGNWSLSGTYPGPVIVGPIVLEDIQVTFANDYLEVSADASVADLESFVNAEATITIYADGRFNATVDVDLLEIGGFRLGEAVVSFGNDHPGREFILDVSASLEIPFGPSITLEGRIRAGGDYSFSFIQDVSYFGLNLSDVKITLSDEEGLKISATWHYVIFNVSLEGSISPTGNVEFVGVGTGKIAGFTFAQVTVDAEFDPSIGHFALDVGAALTLPIPNGKSKTTTVAVQGGMVANTPSWSGLEFGGTLALPAPFKSLFPTTVTLTVNSSGVSFMGDLNLPFGIPAATGFSGSISSKGVVTINGTVNVPILGQATVSGTIDAKGNFSLSGTLNNAVSLGGYNNIVAAGATVKITNKGIYLKASVTLPIVKEVSIDGQLSLLKNGEYQLSATLKNKIKLPGMTSGSSLTEATVTFSKTSVKLAAKASLFELGSASISGLIKANGQYEFAASLATGFHLSKLSANLFTATVKLTNSGIYVSGTVKLPIGDATFSGHIDSKGKYDIEASLKSFTIAGLSKKSFAEIHVRLTNTKVSFSADVNLPSVLGSASVTGTISASDISLTAELDVIPKLGGLVSTNLKVTLSKSDIKVSAKVTLPVFGAVELKGTLSAKNVLDLTADLTNKKGLAGFGAGYFPSLSVHLKGSSVSATGTISIPHIGSSNFNITIKSNGSFSFEMNPAFQFSIGGASITARFTISSGGGITFSGTINIYGIVKTISGKINTNGTIDLPGMPNVGLGTLLNPDTYIKAWRNLTGSWSDTAAAMYAKLPGAEKFIAERLSISGASPDDIVNALKYRLNLSWLDVGGAARFIKDVDLNEMARVFQRQSAGAAISDIAAGLKNAFPGASGIDFRGALQTVFDVPYNEAARVMATASKAVSNIGGAFSSGLKSVGKALGINSTLVGSFVYFDANFNLTLDTGESWTFTDDQGEFLTLVGLEFDTNGDGFIDDREGQWVIYGGIDASTGLPNPHVLIGGTDNEAITPITTLIQLVSKSQQIDTTTAANQVAQALGLSTNIDLLSYDAIQGLRNGDPQSLEILKVHAQLGDSIGQLSALFDTPDDAPAEPAVAMQIISAIANQITSGSPQLDVTNISVVETIIQQASSSLGVVINSDVLAGAAEIVASANAKIDAIDNSSGVAGASELFRIKKLTQGTIAAELSGAARGLRNIAAVVAANTGTAFDAQVDATLLTPLLITPPQLQTFATSAAGAIVNFDVSARDIIGNPLSVTLSIPSGATFAIGETNVTASAVDAMGNSVSTTFAVIVRDVLAPSITVTNYIAEASSAAGAIVNFAAIATDAVDAHPMITYDFLSGQLFPIGTTIVTATAVDHFGNTSQSQFAVTVSDTIAPTILVPANIVVVADDEGGAVVEFDLAAAIDLVDAEPLLIQDTSPRFFPVGITAMEVIAMDADGNTRTETFTVTVLDNLPPELTVPSNIVLEANSQGGATLDAIPLTITDLGDEAPVVSYNVSFLPLGTSLVTATATDSSGNFTSVTFTVEVVDTTPPELPIVENVVIEANTYLGANIVLPATVIDIADPAPSLSYSVPAGFFSIGVTAVEASTIDASGNEQGVVFAVTVVDTTPPSISATPNIVATATSPAGALIEFSDLEVLDLADEFPEVVFSHEPGQFPIGTTIVTVTATDESGNQHQSSFAVTVLDPAQQDVILPAITQVNGNLIEGAPIELKGQAINGTNGQQVSGVLYHWAVYRAGSAVAIVTSTETDQIEFSFRPADNGDYRVVLGVEDLNGELQFTESILSVTNSAPGGVLHYVIEDAGGTPTIRLTATAEDVSAADTQSGFVFDWEVIPFDGETYVETNTSGELMFELGEGGIYTVRVTVTDQDGGETLIEKTFGFSAPTAENAVFDVDEDDQLFGELAGSDSDGDQLMYSLSTAASHGFAVVNDDGSFSYEPHANYSGIDQFTYRVFDGISYSDIATVAISVQPVNDSPVGTSTLFQADEDTTLSATLTGSDLELDSLMYTLASGPSFGTLTLASNGTFVYTPDADYFGLDNFSFQVFDGTSASEVVEVQVVVRPVNDQPVASDVTIGGTEDVEVSGVLVAQDIDSGSVLFHLVHGPAHGTLELLPNGAYRYLPHADFHGDDVFTYVAHDGASDSETATVIISVAAVNKAPEALNYSGTTVAENSAIGHLVGTFATVDRDAEDTHSYSLITGIGAIDNDRFTIDGNQLRLAVSPNFEAKSGYSVRIRSTDSGGQFIERVLVIGVADINEAPTSITLLGSRVIENSAVGTVVGTLGASDVDFGDVVTFTLAEDSGDIDQAAFVIVGNELRLAMIPDFETKSAYSVRIRATDVGGLVKEGVFQIAVSNIDELPTLTVNVTDVSVVEGQTAAISGLWSDTFSNNISLTASVGTVTKNVNGSWSWSLATSNGPGESQTVTITASNAFGGTASQTFQLNVNNAPPTITSLTNSAETLETATANASVTLNGVFTDAGLSDIHHAVILWGDGTQSTLSANGPEINQMTRTFSASHPYTSGGVFTISVTLFDNDGGSATWSTTSYVAGARLHEGVLQVIGTPGDDDVTLSRSGSTQLRVNAAFVPSAQRLFTLADVTQIVILLGNGYDKAVISSNITLPTILDGGAGNDDLRGGDGSNEIRGGLGDDSLRGGDGNDLIVDLSGNNYVNTGKGDDVVQTGPSHDEIWTDGGGDLIDAGDGDNEIHAGRGNNTIIAGSGNDRIWAGGENDIIHAGHGNNEIRAGRGTNLITTGDGDDKIWTNGDNDTIYAGHGNNEIRAGRGNNFIVTGNGNDLIWSNDGDDTIEAGDGDNEIRAGSGNNQVISGTGNDRIWTSSGNDVIFAGSGNNEIYAGAGNDRITTGSGHDAIWGEAGDDIIDAGNGDNTIDASSGNDIVTSGSGNDVIMAGSGDDLVRAGTGNDTVRGGAGNDILLGEEGDDEINGDTGRDLIIAGIGADRLLGNTDDDLLIAGYTSYDASDVALQALLQEWASSANYATRVSNLQSGTGRTGGRALIGSDGVAQTVFNDYEVDELSGNQGTDWFMSNQVADNGGPLDRLIDKSNSELSDDSDF